MYFLLLVEKFLFKRKIFSGLHSGSNLKIRNMAFDQRKTFWANNQSFFSLDDVN